MKNKSLLPIFLLAGLVLGGCNGWNPFAPKSSGDQSESDTTDYKVEIANKDQLEGAWYQKTTRNLDVTLTPAANPLQELNKKNLVVKVEDETVVKATGLGLNAVGIGSTTITVEYHGAKDSVHVTILDPSPKAKYGTVHEGDAEDPLDNEDAILIAKSPKYEQEVYYVKGIISSFYYAPGARTDGNVAYFLTPAEPGGEKFEVFKCYKEDGSALTDDDIWVGGEATAYGAFTVYNNTQAETSSAKFVSCTGEKPHDRVVVDKTFEEVLAASQLEDGADTWDYYRFEAYVTSKDGSNFFLTATQGEELHQATYSGGQTYYDNAFEIYRLEDADALAYMLKNAKVKVTSVVKNYHGQVENLFALAAADIELLEAGTSWDVAPEPDVLQGTLAEFIANEEGNGKRAYILSAEVKSFKNGAATNDPYGNMVLTDGENDLIIYGSTMTADALVWDGTSNKYIFTNPQDFQTNEESNAIKIGDTVQMKLIRADYKTTIEGTGIILDIEPGEGGGTDPVAEPDVIEGTLAEFIANTEGNGKRAYIVSAEVKSFKNGAATNDQFGNMVLTDGENDLIIYGSTMTESALVWDNLSTYVFTNPKDFQSNEQSNAIAIGDTVEMKLIRCDYNTTIEGCGIIRSITPGQGGGTDPVAEPDVLEGTLAEFIANTEGNGKRAYHLSAEVKSFKNGGTDNDQFGNMVLTDGENDLIVYGSTMDATALVWDEVSTYVFTNPKDFQSNEQTNAIQIGDTVEMKLIRCDYNTTIEGCGIIISITEGEHPTPIEYLAKANFTDSDLHGWTSVKNTLGFYSGSGIKLNSEGLGVKSPSFEAPEYGVKVSVNIGAINTNSKTSAADAPVFTITAYNSSDEVVGTAAIENDALQLGENEVEIEGTGIVYITVVYTSFYNNGEKYCNLGLAGVKVQALEGSVTPVQIAQPVGNFSGHLVASDDSNVFVTVALGDEAAYVEVGNLKVTTTYLFDDATGDVLIDDENLGTLTAVFDETADALTQVTFEGPLAQNVKNNGEITLNNAEYFWTCDETTEELQTIFKRRYGDPWTVDTKNDDRLVSVENGIAGNGMKVRSWNGGRYALNLGTDLEAPVAFKNIGFWVYNSGSSDVAINIFCYKGAGFTNFINPGTVYAKAGQWTYCRMGFDDSIVNFQLLDNTKIGTALVFDNIALF